jgi:hypothetical protein
MQGSPDFAALVTGAYIAQERADRIEEAAQGATINR